MSPRSQPRRRAAGEGWVAAARRAAASTGPWPLARSLRAAAALALAVGAGRWAVTADPALAGLFELPALSGIAVLAIAVLRGRTRLLAPATALLTLACALAIAAASPPAPTAALVGAGLAAAHELARWSIERRVDPVDEGTRDTPRWRHLGGVLALGWLVGTGAVALAAGRLALSLWHVAIAAVAAVAVAGVIAAAARSQA